MKLHYKVVCVIKFKYNINSGHQSSYDGDIVGIGLHPYDWTDRVRRVWRGISLIPHGKALSPLDYTLTLPDLPNLPNPKCPVSGVHSNLILVEPS